MAEDRLVQAIVLVADLDAAARDMKRRGLGVVEGGRHPGRGTANLIVPFQSEYLELLAVVDEAEARSSPQGRAVWGALSERGPGLARWSVEPVDIEAVARRVGLPVERRQRVRPDGVTVRWRSVGVDEAWAEPWRCAYMSWDDPATHPARGASGRVPHPNGATGFAALDVVATDRAAALAWMGGATPAGVDLIIGPRPGPVELRLASPTGEIPFP